jgi:hypothetical protein
MGLLFPIWSPRFQTPAVSWLEVPISLDPDFTMGMPRVVLEGPCINVPGRSYDVSPDGSRFLVILDQGNEEFSRHVEVVLNWFDELERLVPTQKAPHTWLRSINSRGWGAR